MRRDPFDARPDPALLKLLGLEGDQIEYGLTERGILHAAFQVVRMQSHDSALGFRVDVHHLQVWPAWVD